MRFWKSCQADQKGYLVSNIVKATGCFLSYESIFLLTSIISSAQVFSQHETTSFPGSFILAPFGVGRWKTLGTRLFLRYVLHCIRRAVRPEIRDFLSILSHPPINVDVLVMHIPTKEDKFVCTEDRLYSVHYFNSNLAGHKSRFAVAKCHRIFRAKSLFCCCCCFFLTFNFAPL